MKGFTLERLTKNGRRVYDNIILIICEVKQISTKMACLIFLLLLAMGKDIKSYKISNQLILIGIFLGLFIRVYEVGWIGIVLWFSGVIPPIFFLFPLFLFKVLGAGDIKLFSVIGGFYGVSFVFQSVVFAFIIAAIMSVIHLIKYNQVFYRLQLLVNYIQTMSQQKNEVGHGISKFGIVPYYDVKRDGYKGVIHFSIAIVIAMFIQALLP